MGPLLFSVIFHLAFIIFLLPFLLCLIFPNFNLSFSIFPQHFPFLSFFLASLFPISRQKFPGGKSGGHRFKTEFVGGRSTCQGPLFLGHAVVGESGKLLHNS